MKLREIELCGLISVLVLIIAVSGCTSGDNSTKHYDNGNISFDYPSSMSVKQENSSRPFHLNIHNNQWSSGVQITPSNPDPNYRKITIEEKLNASVNGSGGTSGQFTQLTIDGKPAYNITHKNQDGSTSYTTLIDLGTIILTIQPTTETSVKDQTTSDSYKAYDLIVKTIKIK